jgi:hypothetical protein
MFREKCASQLCNIPLSNNTVTQQIADVSVDLEEQLIEKLRNKYFSIWTDEATDCSSIGRLIAYVWYVVMLKMQQLMKTSFSAKL